MPATSTTGRSVGKQTEQSKSGTAGAPKKRRVTRRRGRTRGELDSDDEIEREVATDESDSDADLSDNSSATDDSDTEPASEDVIPHDRTHLPTPRNSKSPDSIGKGNPPSFFAPGTSWSEMVDEGANGDTELPVVDFVEFGTKPLAPAKPPTRKAKKAATKAKKRAEALAASVQPITPEDHVPAPTVHDDKVDESPATATASPTTSRRPAPGQSARQMYQEKLDTDPSYVPTIGNFWSHDDRLIGTELRNLSGWWRGRGGRGRGRGRGGFAIRGRGGFTSSNGREDNFEPPSEENVPPIERAWTHDGFEEMKKRDDQRRAEKVVARQAQASPKRGFAVRGSRGIVAARGRGVGPRNRPPLDRVRFAMKPPLMWTKQHEAFLFFDSTTKPRPGQGAGYRLRLPGQSDTQIVKVPIAPATRSAAPTPQANLEFSSEDVVVRLPKLFAEEKESAIISAVEVEQVPEPLTLQTEVGTTVIFPPEEAVPEPQAEEEVIVSALEPISATERPALAPLQTTFTPPPPPPAPQPISQPSPYGYHVPLPPGITLNTHGMPYELATGRPVYLQPPPSMYNPRPMMQYPHPSMSFHPGHMQQSSISNASPDFLAQPPPQSPPVNGFIDPATGTSIFSFPRQTTRIEIRPPVDPQAAIDGIKSSVKVSAPRTPSGLRSAAPTFQPQPTRPIGYYQHHSATPSDVTLPSYETPQPRSTTSGHAHSSSMEDAGGPMGPGMMQPYPGHYPHPHYYYPDPYGYPQYMDMSHAGQTYDVYGMEQVPQGTVYY